MHPSYNSHKKMISNITARFNQLTCLKSKVFLIAGVTFALLFSTIGTFYVYTNWNKSETYTANLYTEKAKINASYVNQRVHRAIGVARTLSMSADFMFQNQAKGTDNILKATLSNLGHRLSRFNDIILYQAAYCSFNSRHLPGSTSDGRLTYLATNDREDVTVTRKSAFDESEYDQCLATCESLQKVNVSLPHSSRYANGSAATYVISVVAPISHNGQVAGSAGVDIPLAQIQNIIKSMHIPQGATASLVAPNGEVVASTIRRQIKKAHTHTSTTLDEVIDSTCQTTNPDCSSVVVENGQTTFVVPVQMDQTDTTWALCISIPNSILYKSVRNDALFAILITLVCLALCLYLSKRLAENITAPIVQINDSIKQLAKGEIVNTQKLHIESKTEIGQIAESVNQVIEGLGKTMQFANGIGHGDFDSSYALLSKNDHLGHSLLEMKGSLQKAKEVELQRQNEEAINRWINEGLAKFADILRNQHTDIKDLAYDVIRHLVKYLDINQGGIFLQDDHEQHLLKMAACFAYNRRKMFTREIEVGEGLIGSCFTEAETIYLLEVPENYISITSGLGNTPPKSLLLVPLKYNEVVNGVIELASITPISEFKIEFVQKVAESIASTINNVRTNEHTSQLLEQTKFQAQEMAAAEEELRQNLEEMRSTQEEMSRVLKEENTMMEKLSIDSQMINMLLTNSTDYILLKDRSGRYQKVSDSAKKLLHIQHVEEAIGKTSAELLPAELASELDHEDHLVILSKKPTASTVFRAVLQNGHEQELEKSKYPIINEAGEVVGLTSIYKIISNA